MPKGEEEGIRVYLRIRPPPTSQQSCLLASSQHGAASGVAGPSPPPLFQYEVEEDFHKSIVHLHTTQRLLQDAQRSAGVGSPTAAAAAAAPPVPDDVVNNTVVDFRYRFDRVFKPGATQEDVFNTVAKDCVASVLDGLNSTIFAYGQTGSGKTYSITGGTESYQDRGLIPRAMAMIYEEIARRRESSEEAATTFSITTSYLQIYNDKGQDLLNHGHDARTLEELPPVTIHEMEEDVVLKGLEQHSAPTLSDALNLLFLGDTNRLYCETPMNKTSSRSHCIFTVYIEARSATSSTVRRSKLNLVDLAGSERVSKTGVSGTILTEAKHINLSLHFLEQVIVALSEKAKGVRDHIPYRNAFLTMVLRDSLGRNCKTAMLATAHVVASQVAETISTCQFAQRVAMIRQAPQVNIETDPVLLVKKLKMEVAQLKDEVAYLRANGCDGGGGSALSADRALSEDEKGVCRGMVDAFVQRAAVDGDWSSRLTGFNGDVARMYYCYDVLRERLIKGGMSVKGVGGQATATAEAKTEEYRARLEESEAQVKALRQSLQLKENELQMLLTVLKKAGAGGAGGSGVAGARYNAPAQTLTMSGSSAAGDGGDLGDTDRRGFQFLDEALPHESCGELRRRIYQAAQELIQQLRQSSLKNHNAQQSAAKPTPVMPRAAAVAAAQAALTRVTALAQQGQLTEAEAAVATEFLESKKGLQQRRPSDAAGGGSVGSRSPDGSRSAVDVLMDEQLVQDRAQALEAFKATYEAQHKVEETKQLLKPKYESCKATAQQLNACVDAIKQLKTKIQRRRAERAADGVDEVDSEEADWLEQLRTTKEQYNVHATKLRQDKEEIDGMHAYLKHAQEQLVRDFERWFSARQQQVQLAVQQQQRHALQGREEARQAGLVSELRAALGATETKPSAATGEGESSHHYQHDSNVAASPVASTAPPHESNEAAIVHEVPTGTAHHSNHSTGGAECQTPSTHVQCTSSAGRSYPYTAPTVTALANAVAQPWHRATPSSAPSPSLGTVTVSALASAPNVDLPRQPFNARAQSQIGSPPTHMPTELPSSSQLQLHAAASARTPELTSREENKSLMGLNASFPAGNTASLAGLIKTNGWMTATAAGAAGGLGGATPSPTRPFRLQPLNSNSGEQQQQQQQQPSSFVPSPHLSVTPTTLKGVSGGAPAQPQSNPYFPIFPSTGNAAADEQLAQLYKAREAMRKQLQ
ncbi:putative kinesin [Leptomonas seymouri]|uniref:Putative kinesin n=1 Tax=Leptomonas seymouri TaxID=5684 RepID=A0A0N0P345_LEPSE|nr:putative kinesin [Leptomonas seymouri]|eukprot:KPI83706.1 putative kinesin [Leptomonas seymouri]